MLFKKRKAEDEIISLLGKGAELTGEISFTNGLRVEGIISGKVRSEAILEIGAAGKVDAEVHIRRISINGEFHGVVHASDRVEIHKDGKVFGDIYTPCLIIDAGAVFDGHCNMSSEKKSKSTDQDASLKLSETNTVGKAL
jgi:cytoskeletal protein CcmA (bactofilin family)